MCLQWIHRFWTAQLCRLCPFRFLFGVLWLQFPWEHVGDPLRLTDGRRSPRRLYLNVPFAGALPIFYLLEPVAFPGASGAPAAALTWLCLCLPWWHLGALIAWLRLVKFTYVLPLTYQFSFGLCNFNFGIYSVRLVASPISRWCPVVASRVSLCLSLFRQGFSFCLHTRPSARSASRGGLLSWHPFWRLWYQLTAMLSSGPPDPRSY